MNRIKYIDILKGIGIILIVYAHAHGAGGYNFLVLSVMLFYIISGFLHNSEIEFKKFVKKKFFRLYLPFVCCNLFLPILTLIKRFGLGLEIKDNIIYIVKIMLLLAKDGFLFGATWFIGNLFIISLFIKFLEGCCKVKEKYLFIGLIMILITIVAEILDIGSFARKIIIGGFFYYIGVLLNKYKTKLLAIINPKIIYTLSFLILLYFWYKLPEINYQNNTVPELLILLITSLAFYCFMVFVSKLMDNKVKIIGNILSYIGKNSLHVLIWHFVFFEIVTAFIMHLNHIPIILIEQYPHVISESILSKLIYFSSGLFGSLILAALYTTVYKYIKILCQNIKSYKNC